MSSSHSLAIIPARAGSKRVPGKNIRDFYGKPAIAYAIEAAIKSGCFSEVMVSTQDGYIAQLALKLGASVPFMRSEHNSGDGIGLAEVASEVLVEYRERAHTFEYFCCLLPTAVFVTPELIKHSMTYLINEQVDAVIPVVRFSYPIDRALHFQGGRLSMIYPNNYNVRSQDLEPAYHDAGQFYCLNTKRFLLQKKYFCENTIGVEVMESRVQDIDSEEDWKMAEIKFALIKGEPKS
jgi:N-acylneuraminate cytidylyltransferase